MKKRIFHNWGLKLASLILASVLWFLVAKIGDPPDTVTFYNIPVKLVNTELLDKENKVYEVLDKTDSVRVTIRAPRSVTNELRSTDIVAEADMAKLTDINTIEISYLVPNVVENIKGDHDVVRLNVEERSTRWIRVQCQTEGEVADEYMVAGVSLDQNRIEVTGPKSAVEQISYAGITVDVEEAASNISLNMEPLYYNSAGEVITLEHVTKNVGYIHVDVDVLFTKEVPLEFHFTGTPAEGYAATGRMESSVDSIKIAGKPATLANISKVIIPEEEMDITGETKNRINVINVRDYLPENVRFADNTFNGRVTVTVFIEALVDKTFNLKTEDFRIQGLPEGYELSFAENTEPYSVTVNGMREEVYSIIPSNVVGTIDVEAWMKSKQITELKPGTYDIPVTFNFSNRIKMKNEVVAKIIVTKTEAI